MPALLEGPQGEKVQQLPNVHAGPEVGRAGHPDAAPGVGGGERSGLQRPSRHQIGPGWFHPFVETVEGWWRAWWRRLEPLDPALAVQRSRRCDRWSASWPVEAAVAILGYPTGGWEQSHEHYKVEETSTTERRRQDELEAVWQFPRLHPIMINLQVLQTCPALRPRPVRAMNAPCSPCYGMENRVDFSASPRRQHKPSPRPAWTWTAGKPLTRACVPNERTPHFLQPPRLRCDLAFLVWAPGALPRSWTREARGGCLLGRY